MKILIDTNVIIDFLLSREPFQQEAARILAACAKGEQDRSAEQVGADYIVTRNVQDFACSVIPAINPVQFCQQFLPEDDEE